MVTVRAQPRCKIAGQLEIVKQARWLLIEPDAQAVSERLEAVVSRGDDFDAVRKAEGCGLGIPKQAPAPNENGRACGVFAGRNGPREVPATFQKSEKTIFHKYPVFIAADYMGAVFIADIDYPVQGCRSVQVFALSHRRPVPYAVDQNSVDRACVTE